MQTAKKRLTIYDIKRLSKETSPFYFNSRTLKYFGQTLKMFSVSKINDTTYFIQAPRKGGGFSERYFNTLTNELTFKQQ